VNVALALPLKLEVLEIGGDALDVVAEALDVS